MNEKRLIMKGDYIYTLENLLACHSMFGYIDFKSSINLTLFEILRKRPIMLLNNIQNNERNHRYIDKNKSLILLQLPTTFEMGKVVVSYFVPLCWMFYM